LQLFVYNKKKNAKSKYKKITKNSISTLFSIPADGSNKQAVVFRQYSELDLKEMVFIKAELDLGHIINKIDAKTALSEVHGATIFQ
jgi:hypothetical protein